MFSTIGFQLLVSSDLTRSEPNSGHSPVIVIYEVAETGSVDNSQMKSNSILFNVCMLIFELGTYALQV